MNYAAQVDRLRGLGAGAARLAELTALIARPEPQPAVNPAPKAVKPPRKRARPLDPERLARRQVTMLSRAQGMDRRQVALAERIISRTARFNGLVRADLYSKTHARAPSRARHVAMFLCRELTTLSLPEISRLFRRHYSTVLVAVRLVGRDPDLAREAALVRECLEGTDDHYDGAGLA